MSRLLDYGGNEFGGPPRLHLAWVLQPIGTASIFILGTVLLQDYLINRSLCQRFREMLLAGLLLNLGASLFIVCGIASTVP